MVFILDQIAGVAEKLHTIPTQQHDKTNDRPFETLCTKLDVVIKQIGVMGLRLDQLEILLNMLIQR
jgi:hypothetical protein